MNGKLLDNRYQLLEYIGAGGMALVYKALDQRTHHFVAVKILKPEYNHDEEFLQRFDREALAASKVSHHNIVNLLDVGVEGEYRYIVLEYIEGRTLKDIIDEKGALPPDTAVQIAIRILSALQHMHKNGIIHRDIKPQNILINSEGIVKVSDFGIARMADSATIGREDMVMGSVHYFSPEQAQGKEVSAASDIYSVGIVLYEMLTGSVPFDGDTPVAIAMQHVSVEPRPPHIINSDVSPALERVVLKALQKDPAKRYQRAEEMGRELHTLPEKPPETPETDTPERVRLPRRTQGKKQEKKQDGPPRRRWTRRLLEAALCALVVMGLVFGSMRLYQSISSTANVPFVIGETENGALMIIARAGLTASVSRASDSVTPAGYVIQQSPEYDTALKKGDSILITVSTGPREQQVPGLYGMPLEKARQELEKLGFSLAVSGRVLSDRAWDTVLEQEPAAGGMLTAGGIVQVTVSGGSVVVPRLTGMTRQEALMTAESLQLRITEVREYPTEDTTRFEIVADQIFLDETGTKAEVGSRVMEGTTGTIVVYVDAARKQETEP